MDRNGGVVHHLRIIKGAGALGCYWGMSEVFGNKVGCDADEHFEGERLELLEQV